MAKNKNGAILYNLLTLLVLQVNVPFQFMALRFLIYVKVIFTLLSMAFMLSKESMLEQIRKGFHEGIHAPWWFDAFYYPYACYLLYLNNLYQSIGILLVVGITDFCLRYQSFKTRHNAASNINTIESTIE